MLDLDMKLLDDLKWGGDGLIPCVVQDDDTEEVLMVAYMNKESLLKSFELGEAVYYSRSRKELWHKGETSGHFQKIRDIYYDCDKDTLLLRVEQVGVACHEGEKSCFHFRLEDYLRKGKDEKEILAVSSGLGLGKVLGSLEETIDDRYMERPESAYTTYLFEKGIDKILKKVGEETAEVIIGSKNDGTEELIYEASDLLYHLMVLFREKGVKLSEIEEELKRRFK